MKTIHVSNKTILGMLFLVLLLLKILSGNGQLVTGFAAAVPLPQINITPNVKGPSLFDHSQQYGFSMNRLLAKSPQLMAVESGYHFVRINARLMVLTRKALFNHLTYNYFSFHTFL